MPKRCLAYAGATIQVACSMMGGCLFCALLIPTRRLWEKRICIRLSRGGRFGFWLMVHQHHGLTWVGEAVMIGIGVIG
jgi:hypothetical protein